MPSERIFILLDFSHLFTVSLSHLLWKKCKVNAICYTGKPIWLYVFYVIIITKNIPGQSSSGGVGPLGSVASAHLCPALSSWLSDTGLLDGEQGGWTFIQLLFQWHCVSVLTFFWLPRNCSFHTWLVKWVPTLFVIYGGPKY